MPPTTEHPGMQNYIDLNNSGWSVKHAKNSHDLSLIPQNRVRVEICCWVKPKIDALLASPNSISKHVGLQNVGLTWNISQKLEVHFVM